MKKNLIILLLIFTTGICSAQIIITQFPTAQTITPLLQGNNTTVSNVVINCSSQAAALIDATNSNLGIGNALVLTTGLVTDLPNPNIPSIGYSDWGFPGDSMLADITGQTYSNSYDACIVEFDAVPVYDNIKFNFIFASEDYFNDFSTDYQDNIGVFVSGNGITGKKNLALVPATTLPVNAATINPTTNSSFFIDNINGTTFRYNGFTTPLTGSITTVPLSSYHFKIGIVDLGDGFVDSGLMIDGSGFWSEQSSGIKELENIGFSIFPNPASEIINLNINNANNTDQTLNIYNVTGALVKSEMLNQSNRQINIEDLSNGVYIVEIKSKEFIENQRLIIQR